MSDVFKGVTSSTISVAGRLNCGTIHIGEPVVAVPSMETGVVKSISVNDVPRDWAVAGENMVLQLSNIDQTRILAGDVLCSVDDPVSCAKKFSARIITFKLNRPLLKGSAVMLHRGRTNEPAKIIKLVSVLEKGVVSKIKPR